MFWNQLLLIYFVVIPYLMQCFTSFLEIMQTQMPAKLISIGFGQKAVVIGTSTNIANYTIPKFSKTCKLF
jgi:hypothetical protein